MTSFLLMSGLAQAADKPCDVEPFATPWGASVATSILMKPGTRCWINTPKSTGMTGTVVVSSGQNGAVTVSGNGTSVIYEPKKGFSGFDQFSFVKRGADTTGTPLQTLVTVRVRVQQ